MKRGPTLSLLLVSAALALATSCTNPSEASTTPAVEGTPAPTTPSEAVAQAPETPPARVGDASDWCGGHGVPESMCTVCHPELIPQFQAAGDWCAEHGYPESVCPTCNPMLPPGTTAQPTPPTPASRIGDASDWCAGHGVPESMCTVCHPDLIPQFQAAGDWCAEHGYPESVCPSCNPMQPPGSTSPSPTAPEAPEGSRVGDPRDWCAEHGLPESKCTMCHADLIAHFQAEGDWCAEHGFPDSVCPYCNPMEPPAGVARPSSIPPGTVIRFRDPVLEEMAGIETVPAVDAELGVGVECMARIEFDRNRLSDIRSPIPGIVREVAVDLGDVVAAEDVLFVLESAHVGDLQARRQAARERVELAEAVVERQEALRAESIASARDVEQARQELELAEADLDSIDQSLRLSGASRGSRSGSFNVASPIAGTVIDRPAVLGTFAGESDSLATVADTSRMWALLEVPEWDAAAVQLDQEAELEVDGIAGQVFTGRVTWIAAAVDPRTRTVAVRVEVENPAGLLRANQFAQADINVAAPERAAAVPLEAVQRVDAESVVFVRTEPGVYEPRVVTMGRSDGEQVQISGPVQAGDAVVTTGGFLLRTELSRDSIGAGCCEVEPAGEE